MIRRALLLALLVAGPAVLPAQRGGGSRATKRDEMFDKNNTGQKGPSLKVRDLEDMSPLKLIIDKRKDLKLSDAQVNQLKDAEKALKDKNDPVLKAADSLIRDMKYSLDKPSDDDRARIRGARTGFTEVINQLFANYSSAEKEALASFDAEAQAKANEMLAKQHEERDKTIREKLGPGT